MVLLYHLLKTVVGPTLLLTEAFTIGTGCTQGKEGGGGSLKKDSLLDENREWAWFNRNPIFSNLITTFN